MPSRKAASTLALTAVIAAYSAPAGSSSIAGTLLKVMPGADPYSPVTCA